MTERITVGQGKLRRIYEPAAPDDRARPLGGCLWRRGIRKTGAWIDRKVKDIGANTTLRKWPGYDPEFLEEFRCRYTAGVRPRPEPLGRLRALARQCIFAACGQFRYAAAALRNFPFRRKL